MANKSGPGTPIGFALQAREEARKRMAGVSTPGQARGPATPKAEPIAPATPAPAPKGNSRGERNNNPGNLEVRGGFTDKQPGYIGSDGRFGRFDTMENGIRAQEKLIRSNYFDKNGTTTVDALINRYGNDPGKGDDAAVANYKKYVANKLGVGVGDRITKDQVSKLAAAMREFETGNRSGGGGGASGGGNNVPQIQVSQSNVPGPSGQVNTGVNQQNGRIMNSSGTIESQQRTLEGKAANATSVLDNYMSVLGETQASQMQTTAKFADAARNVNDEMMSATQEMVDRVKPVFATRQRVLDQLTVIQDMDPISRSVRGFFDLNYDQDYLMRTSNQLGAIVKEQSDMYSVMQGLHGDSIEALDRLHNIDSMLPKLREEQANEMVKGSMMQVNQAMQNLGVTMEGVQNESSIIQAQRAARDDLIGRLDGPTVTSLVAQAEQSGGNVTYNGVEFSGQELRERGMQIEQFDISARSARMALANGEAELADKNAGRMMTYMTDSQVDEAIANGGEYEGVQIPIHSLVQEKAARTEATLKRVELDSVTSSPYQAAQASRAAVQYGQQLESRGASVFGNNAFSDETRNYNLQITDVINRITAESRGNRNPAVLGALNAQLAQLKDGYGKAISGKVNRLVGGDETGAGYVTSYLLGDQVTPGAGADMMVHFAQKGGLPAAMRTSAFGAEGMKVVMETVDTLSRSGNNGKPMNPEQVRVEAARRIANPNSAEGKAFREATTGLKFQTAFSNLPSLARDSKNVPTHPFGKINTEEFGNASRRADNAGYAEIAVEIGISPQQLADLYTQGKTEGLTPDQLKVAQQGSTKARVGAAQQRALVAILDQMAPVDPNMSNSSLMMNYLRSPGAASALINQDDRSRQGGIGDWMAGSVSRGGLLKEVNGYASGFAAAVAETEADVQTQSARLARGYRNDVPRRTGAILGSIPGVTRGDVVALVSAIAPLMPKGTQSQQDAMRVGIMTDKGNASLENAGYRTDLARQQMQAVDSAILNGKFEDPNIERIRKRVAGEWLERSKAADNMIDSLIRPLDRE